MLQAGTKEVVIPEPVGRVQHEEVDIFLERTEEENAPPKQQSPAEEVDEEIEVEKADPSPPKTLQAEPSESTKEKSDKIEGELNASRKETPPVSSFGAPTQMDVDPAPRTTAS